MQSVLRRSCLTQGQLWELAGSYQGAGSNAATAARSSGTVLRVTYGRQALPLHVVYNHSYLIRGKRRGGVLATAHLVVRLLAAFRRNGRPGCGGCTASCLACLTCLACACSTGQGFLHLCCRRPEAVVALAVLLWPSCSLSVRSLSSHRCTLNA